MEAYFDDKLNEFKNFLIKLFEPLAPIFAFLKSILDEIKTLAGE